MIDFRIFRITEGFVLITSFLCECFNLKDFFTFNVRFSKKVFVVVPIFKITYFLWIIYYQLHLLLSDIKYFKENRKHKKKYNII